MKKLEVKDTKHNAYVKILANTNNSQINISSRRKFKNRFYDTGHFELTSANARKLAYALLKAANHLHPRLTLYGGKDGFDIATLGMCPTCDRRCTVILGTGSKRRELAEARVDDHAVVELHTIRFAKGDATKQEIRETRAKLWGLEKKANWIRKGQTRKMASRKRKRS